jgi:DNA-binding NarL/FixJ family response regulator
MHGRNAEWSLVAELQRRVRDGRGGVLLVEGEAGIGKSLLLAEAAEAARSEGFSVVRADAHELEREIPLCSMLMALSDSDGLFADVPGSDPGSQMRAITLIGERIAKLAQSGPVLVTVDDVQFADPVTMLALRLLPRQLAGDRVGWVLARAAEPETGAESLFRLLRAEGATGVTLHVLPEGAVAGLAGELAGGRPGPELLAALRQAGGNPGLVREFIAGLREEQLLLTAGGQVTVTGERVPRRLHEAVLGRLGGLGAPARQLLEVAAVLGRSFAVADVAEMLGQPPVAVLPALNEALTAGIIVADGEVLSFRDPLTWSAVAAAVPAPVARALHLQFAGILLDRGSAGAAARYLLSGARRGDRRELGMLSQAAAELVQAAPGLAADLALRSLELTADQDPVWLQRSVTAARILAAARRHDEAIRVAEAALTRPATSAEQAELHCRLASSYAVTGELERAAVEARWVLSRPDVPAAAREDASLLLTRVLAGLLDQQQAQARARVVLAARQGSSGREVTAATGLLARVRWRDGQLAEGLRLYRDAASGGPLGRFPDGETRPCPVSARLDLASSLIDLRQLDEASALIDGPVEEPGLTSTAEAQARPLLLRSRIGLIQGRLDDAATAAQAMLDRKADGDSARDDYDALAQNQLAIIAFRRGDLPEAERLLTQLQDSMRDPCASMLSAWLSMTAAFVADAYDVPGQAITSIAWLYDGIGEFRWLLVAEPVLAPWLVRLALAAGDSRRAARAAAQARELGRANHIFRSVAASGMHAAGLLGRDAEQLTAAVTVQPDGWARALAAEDLGALLADGGSDTDAVRYLDTAHDGYTDIGAARDLARVRQRLRTLGVTRRHRTASRNRPAGARGGLTETEAGIAELAAHGLTNKQIAEQSFVSVNTVAFHLRQIFRKLGVASRVELAAIVFEERQDAT